MLGRIFAHRRKARTVVRAPLLPVEELPAPPVTGPGVPWSAGTGPDAPDDVAADVAADEAPAEDEPAVAVAPEPEPVPEPEAATELEEAPAPVVGEPVPDEPAPVEPVPEAVPEAVPEGAATRFCPMCGDRVPIDADGLHCYLGHRLSPAHAPRRRRWFGRG